MTNSFWSYNYTVRRLREKAEEYGIKVVEASEYKTSSTCPRCLSKNTAITIKLNSNPKDHFRGVKQHTYL